MTHDLEAINEEIDKLGLGESHVVPYRPIIGWSGYSVTSDGRVLSSRAGRELVQSLNGDGYSTVGLAKDGRKVRRMVHRLVAEAFLPARTAEYHQIRHLDGNKYNNRAGNLRWGTAAENAQDRELHGRTSRGQPHSDAIKRGLRKSDHDLIRRKAPELLDALQTLYDATKSGGYPHAAMEKAAAALKAAQS